MRSDLAALLPTLAAVLLQGSVVAQAAPKDDIASAFRKFVAARNAHDIQALGKWLADSPDFIWIGPGVVAHGREAALARYAELFKDNAPAARDEMKFDVMMLDFVTAEVFVGDASPATASNYVLIHTPQGWRVLSILTRGP